MAVLIAIMAMRRRFVRGLMFMLILVMAAHRLFHLS